jgi:hypothetical protein
MVAYGHENRFNFSARSNNRTYQFPVVVKVLNRTLFQSGISMDTAQPALGAAYRWPIDYDADMGGDTHSSRMGDSLAIEDEQIGLNGKLGHRFQNDWALPESEQPGNVGELDRLLRHLELQQREVGIGEGSDHRPSHTLFYAHIHSGDHLRPASVEPSGEMLKKVPLYAKSLFRLNIPRVRGCGIHETRFGFSTIHTIIAYQRTI